MKMHLCALCLLLAGCFAARGQSVENIRIFPLEKIVDSLYLEGYYHLVVPHARHALTSVQQLHPGNVELRAKAEYRLGEVCRLAGYFEEAETHLQAAYSAYAQLPGMPDDIATRMCCALVNCLIRSIKWAEADTLLQTVIQLAEGSPNVSGFAKMTLLWNLGNVRHNQRKYQETEAIYLQTIAWWEKNGFEETEEYAMALWALSALYNLQDRYEESFALGNRGLALRTRMYSDKHPSLYRIYNSMGFNYKKTGEWFKARDHYLRALHLIEKRIGPEYWFCAVLRYNLANVYLELNDYAQAEQYLLSALPITEKTGGKYHSDYPMLLAVLGLIKQGQGEYAEAETYFWESRAPRAKILPPKHPHYAEVTMQIGSLLLEKGEPRQALPLLEEALAMQMEVDGFVHISVPPTLQQLAFCHAQLKDYEKADSLLVVAEEVLWHIYGATGREVAVNLEMKAALKLLQGTEKTQTEVWLSGAQQLRQTLVGRAAQYASGRELEALIGSFRAHSEQTCYAAEKFNLTTLAYDNALYFKNLSQQARAQQIEHIARSGDTVLRHDFSRWQQLQRNLNTEMAKPISKRQPTEALEQELAQTELRLAGVFEHLDAANQPIRWREVRASLRPDEAAIEFVHYKPTRLVPTDSVQYAALVLLPRDTAPRFVRLFEENQLALLLDAHAHDSAAIAALYTRGGKLLDKRPTHGAELYNLVWKPLEPTLRGIKTVYYSPSGLLLRVNPAALPTGKKGRVLADRHALHQMGSTRHLANRKPEPAAAHLNAVLFGGIKYDSASTEKRQPDLALGRSAAREDTYVAEALRHLPDASRDTAKAWEYLDGTEEEVEMLHARMRAAGLAVVSRIGHGATEENLKALGAASETSPDVLHIATHGYFFPDPAPARGKAATLASVQDGAAFRWSRNPLLRSGLILAGAEQAWRTGSSPPDREDGILTAYEISHLNLSNTKLVVLSACETGLGDIRGSEGVYGLQRAFKMAGADYLIVSLWKVPDTQTTAFMAQFYDHWLGGATIHEAFAKAQKTMRKHYGVFAWGAWVLVE